MRLREVPEPKLARGDDVLIRVRACSVNHLDLRIRKGTRPAPLPLILGSACAGQAAAAGAGASGVATGAIQSAKLLGARVFATAGDAKKADLARSLGAEGVVDHYKEDVAAAVKKLNDGKPVDVVADCVGAKALGPSLG